MTDTATEEAAAAESTETEADTGTPNEQKRAARTNLEADVKSVCDKFVTGELALQDGRMVTPHLIAKTITDGRADGSKVSSGAVAACLVRWAEVGYVVLNDKPLAFVDYTDAGRNEGLSALKRAHSARRSAARAALREAAKAEEASSSATAVAASPAGDAPF